MNKFEPKKKNILIDLISMRNPYTGLAVYCQDLIESLESIKIVNDYDITLFVPGNSIHTFSESFRINEINKLHKFFIPNKRKYQLWHTTYQLSKYFPKIFSGKILLTVHDLNFLHENIEEKVKLKFYKDLEYKLKRADKIVAISNFVKNDILNNYSLDPSKIEVIYRSISNVEPETNIPKYIPKGKFFFTVGPIEDKKNFKVLVPMLLEKEFELIIAGKVTDPIYKDGIINYARELGVENRLHILGSIPDDERNWYLKNCAIMPFPSKAEGFGLPVIEAMQFGTPVLLSRFTSLPEIGGDVAFYFDDYDAKSIHQKTKDVLCSIQSNLRLGELLKERALFFYRQNSAEQYFNLYNKMLN